MNAYLEKIAGGIGILPSLGKIFKPVGKTINTSLGGAYREYGRSKGIKDPTILSKLNGGPKGIDNMYDALGKLPGHSRFQEVKLLDSPSIKARKEAINRKLSGKARANFNQKNHFDMLKKKTRNARLMVGGTLGASYLGYNKIKERASSNYNQPTYHYNY